MDEQMDGRKDGRRQNYISPTLSGDNSRQHNRSDFLIKDLIFFTFFAISLDPDQAQRMLGLISILTV